MNDLPIMQEGEGIVLFRPHVPKKAKEYVGQVLDSRWIGQGPRVEEFEAAFRAKFGLPGACISTNSGTSALHLAYELAGIKAGDEVLCPLFTCTATNIPLLHMGAKPVFVDVDPSTLNVSVEDLGRRITSRTKAIVVVHYGGLPCDMAEIEEIAAAYGIPVIEDAAHALGAWYNGTPIGAYSKYTMFSFQAIKHLTTGDGGMLVVDGERAEEARRRRWFGIDRAKKQGGIWENDITEAGHKWQMTDIAAAIGLAGLEEFDEIRNRRLELALRYLSRLEYFDDCWPVYKATTDHGHAFWLMTVLARDREGLMRKLREHGIESGQTHYRNDRYTIFNGGEGVWQGRYPGMDSIENHYLILPLHTHMTLADVDRICDVIRSGW